MILSEFPDLLWLKSQINQRFQNRRGYANQLLDTEGFPSVIIHTTGTSVYRPDIMGPISLFSNINGTSACTVDNRRTPIPEGYFFISNCFQEYTLEIDKPAETFNIHIGEVFSQQTLSALITPVDLVLNNGHQQTSTTISFFNKLYRKDETFNNLVIRLSHLQKNGFHKLKFEETMMDLLAYLLEQHRELVKKMNALSATKRSTRIELFKRLSRAMDLIHASPGFEPDINQLSAEACLSKYHFIRLFKLAFNSSPYQYIQNLKLNKAELLLKKTRLPVQDIAYNLGFENSNSLSRLFYKRKGMYPSSFR